MPIIDADSHVIEPDLIWARMAPPYDKYRPLRLVQAEGNGERQEYLLTNGKLLRARGGGALIFREDGGDKIPAPEAARLLLDVEARLRHMDELGTDIQVVYPTIFIEPIASNPEAELGMCQAYNRWMGEEIWPQGQGRLRWACVPPLRTMDKAIEELRRSREQGACAVFMHLLEFDDKLVSDPYFYPLYEEAARLDMPICFHAGNASMEMHRILADEPGLLNRFTGLGTFDLILENAIPDKFPGLRMAFVEFGAQWLPYMVLFLRRRMERRGRPFKENILRDNRLYVTCETHDDIPYLVQWVGEDNLIAGTDYGHADNSTDLKGLQTLNATLPVPLAQKILYENPRRLYGL